MVDLLVLVNAIQQWLFVPLIVAITVHSLWRFGRNVKQSAGQFVVRVQEALDHERQRLIEDIKADLLKTLNKGAESGHPQSKQQVDKYKEKCNSTFEFSRGSGRLDRKDKTNIVNEIIYQIQSGGTDSNRNCTDDDKVVETGGRIGEDSAILKDVHRRNVVARMKNLFESNESSKWHLNQVVDIINKKRISSTSMENLRVKSLAIPKASSEPPVVRLRRKIRSQQSLSESSIASSIEDILEAERFSKRLSQYSISEYLDESTPTSPQPPPQDFNRISQNLKTLSTFSLSELLLDDEPDNLFAGVTLRRPRRPAVVETIDQILADENLSRCYSQYSISDLVDDEVVFLQDNPPLIQCDSFA
ncbi:hypothetical protein CpipJ_CPIJ003701 [Culex quinquefasciatus]|uniref:Uncharacterized protein n=1 Tax=Culex quinquefasciatus TaxID=7176 RepID=B0W9Z4_CULQU|nr:hypothetical protein CpipJ_CPIJ003701 [Culex quinquefasciatus]|eukprot:XP_001845528.1 hypothetical protein CpipJ_CPIJ003701 [Culex quinquefasciatus]